MLWTLAFAGVTLFNRFDVGPFALFLWKLVRVGHLWHITCSYKITTGSMDMYGGAS
jgi:hypothetical protein